MKINIVHLIDSAINKLETYRTRLIWKDGLNKKIDAAKAEEFIDEIIKE